MLREVALRRAIEDARVRRARELEEVVERQSALRRRLRELQDRLLALGTVHGRFAGPETPPALSPTEPLAPAPPPSLQVEPSPIVPPTVAAPPREAPASASDARLFLAPPKREVETHTALLAALSSRHPEGFTVSQMREVMDATEPERPHSYDTAWGLANNLLRSQALEVAGTKPGPSGAPIRVYRVPAIKSLTAEAG